MSFAAPTIIPKADGSVLMQPGRPIYELTLLKLARQLGCARATVYDHLYTDAIPERFIQPIEGR